MPWYVGSKHLLYRSRGGNENLVNALFCWGGGGGYQAGVVAGRRSLRLETTFTLRLMRGVLRHSLLGRHGILRATLLHVVLVCHGLLGVHGDAGHVATGHMRRGHARSAGLRGQVSTGGLLGRLDLVAIIDTVLVLGRLRSIQAGLRGVSISKPDGRGRGGSSGATYLNEVLALGLGNQGLQLGGGEGVHKTRLRDDEEQDLGSGKDRQFVGLFAMELARHSRRGFLSIHSDKQPRSESGVKKDIRREEREKDGVDAQVDWCDSTRRYTMMRR
jgi:hypothetical protein